MFETTTQCNIESLQRSSGDQLKSQLLIKNRRGDSSQFKSVQVSRILNDHRSQQNSLVFLMICVFFKQTILIYQCRQPTTNISSICGLNNHKKVRIKFLGTCLYIYCISTSVSTTSLLKATMASSSSSLSVETTMFQPLVGTRATTWGLVVVHGCGLWLLLSFCFEKKRWG